MVETEVIRIQDLTNNEDAARIIEAVEHVWGVSDVQVLPTKQEAVITYDERMASSQDFTQIIVEAGFKILG